MIRRLYLFILLLSLLISCRPQPDVQSFTAPDNSWASLFRLYWEEMNRNYLFWDLDSPGKEWDDVYEHYMPLFEAIEGNVGDSEAADEEGYRLFYDISKNLSDGHYSFLLAGSDMHYVPFSIYKYRLLREEGRSDDEIIRALAVSNLIAIHQKRYIGPLSAYCGAVSAAAGAAAGIAFISGMDDKVIADAITNTLASVGGIVCDGAKPSCAAKISSALEAAILGFELAQEKKAFENGEGLVKENIEKDLTLEELASVSGFSVSHFSMTFRKETGHSPLTYFNLLKIRKACMLLDSTDMKMNQICHKIGISDPYYFSRMFSKVMGISPRDYYRKIKKGPQHQG